MIDARVTKGEFYAVVGGQNVHPRVSEPSLKDRVHISYWETADRRVVGRTQTDSWGASGTEYFLRETARDIRAQSTGTDSLVHVSAPADNGRKGERL